MQRGPGLFERALTGTLSWSAMTIGVGVLLLVMGVGLLYFRFDVTAFSLPSWTGQVAVAVGAMAFIGGWILAFAGK